MLEQASHSLPLTAPLPLPPSAGPLALFRLGRDPLRFLDQAVAEQGDIFRVRLGLTSLVIVNSPRQIDYVLRQNARNYVKEGGMWQLLSSLLGNGLVVSKGDFWLRQRRMMQPHFHKRRLAGLTDTVAQAINETITGWQASTGKPVDMESLCPALTMNVVIKAVFGSGLSEAEVTAVSEAMPYAINYILRGLLMQGLPSFVPVPGRAKYHQALQVIDHAVYNIIEQRRRDLANGADGSDLLSMLLNVVDDQGQGMTDQQLHDEIVNLFLAGFETTATAVAWAMHTLANEPAVLDKIRAEFSSATTGNLPTFASLRHMPYARQVVQEVLRLYTPAWQTMRQAVEDDEIDGYRIPAGTLIITALYSSHRHPSVWPNPTHFNPDRFTPQQSASRPKNAWMPFGTGQRKCIGLELAMMEATLAIAMIADKFDLATHPNQPAHPQASLVLKSKNGIWLTLTQRP